VLDDRCPPAFGFPAAFSAAMADARLFTGVGVVDAFLSACIADVTGVDVLDAGALVVVAFGADAAGLDAAATPAAVVVFTVFAGAVVLDLDAAGLSAGFAAGFAACFAAGLAAGFADGLSGIIMLMANVES
jgi:hypothetical protein